MIARVFGPNAEGDARRMTAALNLACTLRQLHDCADELVTAYAETDAPSAGSCKRFDVAMETAKAALAAAEMRGAA